MDISVRETCQESLDLQTKMIFSSFLDQGSQTVYRENETQTVPWRPLYREKGSEIPEPVEVDAELNLKNNYFDQHDVNKVKRFRQRKEWETFLNKMCSSENTDLQKNIVEQLEQEKWKFREKEIDEINKIRLELARKELDEQSAIIKERMEFRMINARNKYEELKRINSEKFKAKLEREVRRTNFKLTKSNHYTSKKTEKIYNVQHPRYLYQPRPQREILCPEAIPTSLNDAYLMLERNLVPMKPLKKDYPSKHNCEIPKFYKIPDNSKYKKAQAELHEREKIASKENDMRKQRQLSSAKSLIATLISGRATQSMIHRNAKINYSALKNKYNGGKKLYTKGIEEAEDFELLVAEGIRDYNTKFKMAKMVQNVIRNLEGRCISTILDFSSKMHIRLQEHRRLLALADVAERERWNLEAKEAGRRQEEQQRLRQHEEMYKEVIKTHEITSDTLLEAIIEDDVENTGCGIAKMWTRVIADYYNDIFGEPDKEEPYRRLEYAARLADRCLTNQSKNEYLEPNREQQLQMFGRISEGLVNNLMDSLEQSSPWDSSESEDIPPSDDEKQSSVNGEEEKHSAVSVAEEESVINENDRDSITSHEMTSQGSEPKKGPEELPAESPSWKQSTEINDILNKRRSENPTRIDIKKDLVVLEKQNLKERSSIKDDHKKSMEEVVEKLLDQVVGTAENYVEKYHLNAKKLGLSTEFMQNTYAESMSGAYQTLAEELLKLSGERSKEKIAEKVSPWTNIIIDEATKRISSIFYNPSEKTGESDKDSSEILFKIENYYNCEEGEEQKVSYENETEPDEEGSLEYIGVLDEKLHLPLIPEEDTLQTITKKKC